MANIFKDKYPTGHKVVIKDRQGLTKVGPIIPSIITQAKANINPGSTVFELEKTRFTNLKYEINLSKSGVAQEIYMRKSGHLYKFIGSKSVLEGIFSHAGDGTSAKSDTNSKTECQELVSLHLFEQKLKFGKDQDYDYIESCLPNKLKKFFNEDFYESAKKQLALFLSKHPKLFKGPDFIFELQLASPATKRIYANALKLSKLNKDNWNPADMWIVSKSLDYDVYETATDIQSINKQLIADYQAGLLVGISLKKILSGQLGQIQFINTSETKKKETKFDFSFELNALTGRSKAKDKINGNAFNNFIIYTKSGFGIRGGFKASSTTYSVSLEGRFKNSGSQVGGMDAKVVPKEFVKRYGYTLRQGGIPNIKAEEKIALQEMKEIYAKHGDKVSVSTDMNTYADFLKVYKGANDFEKQRLCRISSMLYPFMVLAFNKPKKKQKQTEFENLMDWSYSLAKKETAVGGFYVIVKP